MTKDWFRFWLFQEPKRICQLRVKPVGGHYENHPEPAGGSCPPGIGPFTDSDRLAKLKVEVIDFQGQVLASATQSQLGAPVDLFGIQLPFMHVPYYIRVWADSSVPFDEPQLYDLQLTVTPGAGCTDDGDCATLNGCFGTGYCTGGNACAVFFSSDCNGNYVEDSCESDCDGDGIIDACEEDCNENGVPDDCDLMNCDGSAWCSDINGNGQIDGCEPDCNGNGIPDDWDIYTGTSMDVNGDGVPDECTQTRLVPSQYPNLRAAITAANDGDTILVADGVYTSITDENKNINIDKILNDSK